MQQSASYTTRSDNKKARLGVESVKARRKISQLLYVRNYQMSNGGNDEKISYKR